ncbi:uncharacterized protein LOC132791605 [Drosophila nasuta]|uniref:uncharacterized protein LOC132791605 n=1 Tax=Drosophila nasuta TaxID=42062 RepID=UPI00295E9843|nr:uncharacterized protein LOC132791605 [Drosophila nasuta]
MTSSSSSLSATLTALRCAAFTPTTCGWWSDQSERARAKKLRAPKSAATGRSAASKAKAKVFPNHFYSLRNAKINSSRQQAAATKTLPRALQGSLLNLQVVGVVFSICFGFVSCMQEIKSNCCDSALR